MLLYINDTSNVAVEACVLNMYADDAIIYASAKSKDELECTLQVCIDRRRSILYKGSSFWNKFPPWVKDFTSLNDFKHNFRLLNG